MKEALGLILAFSVVVAVFAHGEERRANQLWDTCVSLSRGETSREGVPGKRGPKGEKGDCVNDADQLEQTLTQVENNSRAVERIADLEEELQEANRTIYELKDLLTPRYEIRRTAIETSYVEARKLCAEMGGDLVHKTLWVDRSGKNYREEILAVLGPNNGWFGLTDRQDEGLWLTVDGRGYPVSQKLPRLAFNWLPGQPTNHNGREHCAHYWHPHGDINDAPCEASRYGVCEILSI